MNPPIQVTEGQRVDLNEDGLADFEIDELVHVVGGQEVRSMRLVGYTHIHYLGGTAGSFLLLHARYRGLYYCGERVPSASAHHPNFDPPSNVYAEFLRFGSDDFVTGAFDEFGRSYLGVSVETPKGILWGWLEVTVGEGEPAITAFGYESLAGETSIAGGLPLAEAVSFGVDAAAAGVLLSWRWLPGVEYQIEESLDLKTWVLLDLELARGSDGETGMVRLPIGGPQRYFRLITCRAGSGQEP